MNRTEMEVATRIGHGQKFNFYRTQTETWAVGIGPVSDFYWLADCPDKECANLIAEALRRSLPPLPSEALAAREETR
jgi:hypothetical protein